MIVKMKINLKHISIQYLILSICYVSISFTFQNNLIRIGALFAEENIEEIVALEHSIERINLADLLRGIRLEASIRIINSTNILNVRENICSLLQIGVAAILGPIQSRPAILVQTIADKFEIPHILLRNDFIFNRKRISINMYPNAFTLNKAIIDLIKNLQWKNFVVLYENNEDAIYANEYLKAAREEVGYSDLKDGKLKVQPRNWNVKILQFKPRAEYSDTFWQLRSYDITNFVIIAKIENLYRILKWAQQTGMITYKYSYILGSLDMHSIELEEFSYAKSNIYYFKLTNELNKELIFNHYWKCERKRCPQRPYVNQYLSTSSALVYDSVIVLAQALKEAKQSSKLIQTQSLECNQDISWSYGSTFINLMRSVQIQGITSYIEFDTSTYRSKVKLNLMRLEQNSLIKIGTWSENHFIKEKPLQVQQPFLGPLLSGQKLKVVTVFNKPYIMLKNSSKELIGNERYEGYVVDLIYELSRILNFDYEFIVVEGTKYGNCYQANDGFECDGMLGNITRGEVDLAVVDLTITAERQSAVDFSLPFMNTGIGVLFYKVTKEKISLFSFMNPFSPSVWLCLLLITLFSSFALHIMGRLSPYEWANPYPCKQEEDFLENPFNIRNAVWYINGALLQQGSEFAPRASSTRWTAGVWYFVTLILVSSYTANLAAFLTVVNYEYPFNEAIELLQHYPEIKFGCKLNGSTCKFFKNSNDTNYKKMSDLMEYVDSNDAGRDKVEKSSGGFAYFMESKAIEYDTERYCSVTQRGGLLDNKGYGIAINQSNKTLKRQINEGILQLQEGGTLHILYDRWWKQKGGGTCLSSGAGDATELNLENVGGVFVVLIIGVLFSLIMSILELIYKLQKTPSINQSSLKENLLREIKFAFDFQIPLKDNAKSNLNIQSINSKNQANNAVTNF